MIEPSNPVWTNAITGEFSSAQTGSDVLRLKKSSPSKHWCKSYLFPNCSLLINKSLLDLLCFGFANSQTENRRRYNPWSVQYLYTCIAYPLDAGLCDCTRSLAIKTSPWLKSKSLSSDSLRIFVSLFSSTVAILCF